MYIVIKQNCLNQPASCKSSLALKPVDSNESLKYVSFTMQSNEY